MKCLVTGATGFIGRQLCQQLNTLGATVTALSRTGAALQDGSPTLAIDLVSDTVPDELLAGLDVVFHLAGIAHQSAHTDDYAQLNHRSSVLLAQAAAEQGVKRFIYLSSVKAMGAPETETVRSEADCTLPDDPYGLFKWRCEQDLQRLANASAMSVVILRPCLVYGPKPKGNLASLAIAVRKGLPRPPERGGRSMIAVQDLADLMVHIASQHAQQSGTWIVCDGNRYSLRNVHDSMRHALGKGPAVAWLPLWVWRLAAVVLDGVRRSNTESTYEKLFGSELYSNVALLDDYQWRPKLALSDVVGDMVRSPAQDHG